MTPKFSCGTYVQDQRICGRVIDFRCPIAFPNGVRVQPGDIIFGDIDGVVMIPQQHAHGVVRAALEKVFGENKIAQAIRNGMSTQQAWDT
jgi:regulator of RNase E activity RraA